MKVVVKYTREFSQEDLAALSRFHGFEVSHRLSRFGFLRQLLEEEGRNAVEQQIAAGKVQLKQDAARRLRDGD